MKGDLSTIVLRKRGGSMQRENKIVVCVSRLLAKIMTRCEDRLIIQYSKSLQ